MSEKKRIYEETLAKATALTKKETLSISESKELGELTDRIISMREELKRDDELAHAFDHIPTGTSDGPKFDGEWKPLDQLNSLRFAKADLEQLAKAAQGHSGLRIQAKAVQAETDFDNADAAFFDLVRVAANRSKFRVASLIPAQVKVGDGNSVTYYKPGALATGATAVSEAAALPQSSPTWVAVDEPIRKVGHYSHVPDEAVQDWSDMVAVLGQEMVDGLISVENAQVLVGDGTAPDLAGIFDDSRTGVQTRAQGGDVTITAIMKALGDVRENGNVEPDAIIMRASTWTNIRVIQNANEDYVYGLVSNGERKIDGVPVHLTNDGTASHIYVGSFASAKAYLRKLPILESTNSADDDFIKDLTKFRVTERFALAVPRPEAFCDLTLS
ncbi:MAG: phage major capsid protein [Actinomycetota bacterium]